MIRIKDLLDLIKATATGWYRSKTFQYGAALAFYGAFALAPMLVVAIAIAGILFGEEAAQGTLVESLGKVLGPVVSVAIVDSLTYVYVSQTGGIVTIIGLGFVLFAVTSMFIQLQAALNDIWGVQPKPSRGIRGMLHGRFFAFLLMIGVGALLLLLLIANAVLTAMHAYLPAEAWTKDSYLWVGMKWLLLLTLHTLLFAMIYKLLPDAIITWRDTWIGALITAVLFL